METAEDRAGREQLKRILHPQKYKERDWYFWFPSGLILEERWRKRSKPARAVYSVIAAFCGWQKGLCWIGLGKISKYSGYSIPKVIEAIKELEKHWADIFFVKRNYHKTRSGNWVNEYHLTLPRKNNRGGNFPFHRMLFEELAFAKITNSARSLYPVMRATSEFNLKIYNALEGTTHHPSQREDVFLDREYDICTEQQVDLAWLAGISTDSMKSALASLEKNDLIEPFEMELFDEEKGIWEVISGWKVFLRLP